MAVSASPWWWSPDFAPAATWVWPIQSFSAPALLPEIASQRAMPEVWPVSPLSSPVRMWVSGRCQWSSVMTPPFVVVVDRHYVVIPGRKATGGGRRSSRPLLMKDFELLLEQDAHGLAVVR